MRVQPWSAPPWEMPKEAHTKAAEAQESATRKAHQDFWDGHKSGLYCSDAACGVITTPKGNLKHILLYRLVCQKLCIGNGLNRVLQEECRCAFSVGTEMPMFALIYWARTPAGVVANFYRILVFASFAKSTAISLALLA